MAGLEFRAVGGAAAGGSEGPLLGELLGNRPENTASIKTQRPTWHRALRHHFEGIFPLEALFGPTITLSTGRVLPVRFIGEQHVLEDLGRVPTVADWLGRIQPESWMLGRGKSQACNHS